MEHTEANARVGAAEVRSAADDAPAKAFEMVATPAIFGFGGWLVDGRLGTFPLVTLLLALTVLGYEVWSFVRHYGASMDDALDSRRAGYGTPRPEASRQP